MARLVRGDEVVDVWIEDNVRGQQLFLRDAAGVRQLETASKYSASSEYRRELGTRLESGWQRVRDPARERDVEDEPREPAFEAALGSDPGNGDAALVYADWFQQQDHPRGALIAVQHALALRPDDAALRAEEAAILRAWRDHLDPWVGVGDSYETTLAWQHGFLRAAAIRSVRSGKLCAEHVWNLLRHPSARLLRELRVLSDECYASDRPLVPALLLHAGPRPPLRVLHLAAHDQFYELGSLVGLGDRYPLLEDLVITGRGDTPLGALAVPRVRRFALRNPGLARATLASILAAPWPALAELELGVGSEPYDCECTVTDFAPLLAGAIMPALRTLRLTNAADADALCAALLASPRLATLTAISFRTGSLTDAAADLLIAARERLAGIAWIDVRECDLSAAGIARLREAGVPIVEDSELVERQLRYRRGGSIVE